MSDRCPPIARATPPPRPNEYHSARSGYKSTEFTAPAILAPQMTDRILTAEPGEAAARVARTCKRRGAVAISVVTADHEHGVHVESSDETVVVEGSAQNLDASAILDAATR